ncbi:hypothetical protein GCM10010517_53760 [Streptosporangium fragile]|uniref:Uncharacterized protein n=1 Tax=Streptosporangium fragile TaxID=46186 RepID=A0ABP6IJ85_9ACTN
MSSLAPERPRRTALLRRWPTVLALAPVVATLGGGADGQVAPLAQVLVLLSLLYLVVAKLRRREASWPVLAALLILYVVLLALDVVPPAAVFAGVALAVLVWGAVDGDLRRSPALRAQAFGVIGFGALALAGLLVAPGLGRYLVAAGWFLHGVWDFVHLRKDAVVSRSYAEWCGVVDILIATQLVFLL